jgi:hypothetical protein
MKWLGDELRCGDLPADGVTNAWQRPEGAEKRPAPARTEACFSEKQVSALLRRLAETHQAREAVGWLPEPAGKLFPRSSVPSPAVSSQMSSLIFVFR